MYGAWSLLPPIVAIVLAMLTRRIYASLLVGIIAGAMLLAAGNPLEAAAILFRDLFWPVLTDGDHLQVFAFTLLMGALVGVMRISGGMEGAVAALSRYATNRRRAGLLTWLLGMVIFFDDYANTLLLGTSMRPLADRMNISREKLAYIVDSTAAPVAGLALVSTWIAGEIGYIDDGIEPLQFSSSSLEALNLFVASIPYRFYVVWALLFVPLTILLGREFGPMASAEQRCLRGESADEARSAGSDLSPTDVTTRHWLFAALPVAVVVLVTTGVLYLTGLQALEEQTPASLMNIFGEANSYLALVLGSLAGLITTLAMVIPLKAIGPADIRQAAQQGTRMMFPALAILALAWTLSLLTEEDKLGTGIYLGNFVNDTIHVAWLPTIIFLLASVVAFSTGTSWGIMGILMPLAIAATHKALLAGGPVDAYDPVFLAAIGSVLSGAIFGDHCSPISDTTVLSSQASGCNHMAHVTTQMPYALAVGAAAMLLGTIPIGFGVSVWIMLPVGIVVLGFVLRVCGRRCDAEVSTIEARGASK